MPPDSGVRRAHGEGRRGRAGGDHHVLLPPPGRPDPSADRAARNRLGRASRGSGQDPVEPLVPGDLEHQGRVRHGPGARRSFQAAPRRAQPERDRGGAESWWTLAEGARDAHLADSHASGDARVQIASCRTGRARRAEHGGASRSTSTKERSMATRDSATTKFETVRYERKGAVCHVILNRPEKLNAANDQLVEDVNDALFEFDADAELKVAILSGAGRAFCSGADVHQRQLRTREELKRLGGPAHPGRGRGAGDARRRGGGTPVARRGELPPPAGPLPGELPENPPLAVRANVRVMRWFVNEMQRQSRYYTQGLALHLSDDFQESARAFVEKRKAVFKGR